MATLVSFIVGLVVGVAVAGFAIVVAVIIQEDASAKGKDKQ